MTGIDISENWSLISNRNKRHILVKSGVFMI